MQILNLIKGNLDQTNQKKFWINIEEAEESKITEWGISLKDVVLFKKYRISTYLEFPQYTGILLFELRYSNGHFKRDPLLIFFDKENVISINAKKYFDAYYYNFIVQKKLKNITKEIVVFELLSNVIGKNAENSLTIERDIAHVEETVGSQKNKFKMEQTLHIRKALLRVSRHYWSQRQIIFDFKENRIHMLNPSGEISTKLADLYNAMFFDINLIEQLHTILTDVRDLYLSTISNKINESIKKLTVVTVLLTIISTVSVVPNTVATIFGIPYFPLKADTFIEIGNLVILPWQLVAFLLIISTLIPAWLLYQWWKKNYQHWE